MQNEEDNSAIQNGQNKESIVELTDKKNDPDSPTKSEGPGL